MSSTENIFETGVYRISAWPGTGGAEARVLTGGEQGVTVSPPGAAPENEQEWFVEVREGGIASIQIPARIFPSRSLSYNEAKPGERIILGRVSDFPTREWRIERAPQLPFPPPYFIRVVDNDLMMVISPKLIFPPELELAPASFDLKKAWAFELVTKD